MRYKREMGGLIAYIWIFKKVFDEVICRLIKKLEHADGIKEKVLDWTRDYLVDGEMRTTIKKVNSSWGGVLSGVPQGSLIYKESKYQLVWCIKWSATRIITVSKYAYYLY